MVHANELAEIDHFGNGADVYRDAVFDLVVVAEDLLLAMGVHGNVGVSTLGGTELQPSGMTLSSLLYTSSLPLGTTVVEASNQKG